MTASVTRPTARAATREELLGEIARLRGLLAQAGVDARIRADVEAGRDAAHRADLTASNAEIAAARADAQQARAATDMATAELALSERVAADMRAVLDAVPVGILLAEAPSGRIVMSNGRVAEILGHPPIHAPGIDVHAAFHPDGRRVAAEEWPLARVIGGADRAEMEMRYQRPDGTQIWLAVDGAAVKAGAASVGVVITFRSIESRKRAEAQQEILNRELSHRLKNVLALVQSIAAQTLRNAPDVEAAREALAARLVALGRAHDVLLAGHADSADMAAVAAGALALHEDGPDRLRLAGPPLRVGPAAALSLGLMLHELATNAAKYGALSNAGGHVDLVWVVAGTGDAATFTLTWTEVGGPPVAPPVRRGFGSRLIERGLAGRVGGAVALDYRREGLVCTLTASLSGFQTAE